MMKRLHILFLLLAICTATAAQDIASRYAAHSVLATGKWVKIRVSNAGVYQITNSSLRSMGFSNPDNVRLYGLNLELLPETNIEDIDDDLVQMPLYRTGDKVLFYGRGQTVWTLRSVSASQALFVHTNNPYSNYTYYFLTESTDSVPLEFGKYAYEISPSAPTLSYFPEHALIETNDFSVLSSGRTFFESYDYANGNNRTYTLALPGLLPSTSVAMNVQFVASGSSASTLSVSFNDSTLGTLSFGKLNDYEYGKLTSRTFTVSTLAGTSNSVKLTHNRASGVTGHLDYIRASYLRQLQMTGNELLFRPATKGDAIFQLSGGDENTVLWHITHADGIEEVAGSYDSSTGLWSFPFSSETTTSSAWRDEQLVAVNPSASFPSPTVVGTVGNQDLHATGDLDLVIVVPTSGKLTQQAQRLADAHTATDSMKCAVFTADQIYNEFSSGTPDATAIRRFMKMLYDRAGSEAARPRNLLLFGDGVWDNRMCTSSMSGQNPDDYLLCYESDNSLSHTNSYVMEEYYALVDDGGTSAVLTLMPRLGVGRIPAQTASEAKDVVDKLIPYINNEQAGAWKNTICVLCDDGNDNIHMADGDAVISSTSSRYPDFYYKRIYWDTYTRENNATGKSYPGVESDIDKQMTDGALIMNYTGHGAAYILSHEQAIKLADFASWSSPRLPLWITAACDVAPFDMNTENIGETALLNKKGAAMGMITTARTVYSTPNRAMNIAYMKHVLGTDALNRRITIGEALSYAKAELVTTSTSSINKTHFVLLGDPAIKLILPTYKMQIDQINGTDANSDEPQLFSAGEKVTVSGHIVDEDGNTATLYNGTVSPDIFDNIELVTCKNNSFGESNGNTSTVPYTFRDRIRTLYHCTDTVQNGQFSFTFPIPLDNNYSGEAGLIHLYAVNTDKSHEANGTFTNFLINGTSSSLATDTQGPNITFYLNTASFQSGNTVNETPVLYATLSDEDGINMTGSGIGHDIVLIIDNDESTTYSLNSYFTPTMSDYRSGTVQFSIPELSDGLHTLLLRAYDVLNNPTTVTAEFYVNAGLRPTIYDLRVNSPVTSEAVFTIVNDRPNASLRVRLNVYDIAGRHLWAHDETDEGGSGIYTYTWNLDETDSHLPSGIYIVRAAISTSDGPEATESKKFVVLRRKD